MLSTLNEFLGIDIGDNLCLTQCMTMLLWIAAGKLKLPVASEASKIAWLANPPRGLVWSIILHRQLLE